MKQIYYVIQTLLRGRGSNIIKILSLGLALTMSILLFVRVAFEQSYDTCYRDPDRIYQLFSIFTINGERGEPGELNLPPVAGAVLENFPQEAEAAVNVCKYMAFGPLYNGSVRFKDYTVMADSLFFQTLGIDVLRGDPLHELQQKDVVFLSDRLAQKMFGDEDPIGKVIGYDKQLQLTVKGVYVALPENSTMNPEAVISIVSAWSRDWAENSWEGGDSFFQYIRFHPGVKVDVEKFNTRLEAVIQNYLPQDGKDNSSYTSIVKPLRDVYRGDEAVRRMNAITLILGLAILFIAALNYVLISISSLSYRAKAVGVHKCNGASGGTVFSMFLLETSIIILLSLILMAFLLLNFREMIEEMMEVRLTSLFALSRIWVPLSVIGILFVIGGVLPGRMFSRIPVSLVFRHYTEGKKGWKRPLLFIQFLGVAFICGLMCVIMAQYHYVLNKDTGYDARRIATSDIYFESDSERDAARQFFLGLPYVEDVESASYPPCIGMSGMRILNESGQSLFSSRYCVETENYPKMMGMTMKEGRMARERNEAVVNETFAKTMRWGDDVVGRIVHQGNTGLGDLRIVGVLKDFHTASFYVSQQPLIVRCGRFGGSIHVRLKEPFVENLRRLNSEAAAAFPAKTVDFYSLELDMQDAYGVVRIFRDATILATVVMFFVMLMGLIGYTTDEVRRRSKEIAIRKVNGAESSTILEMLSLDVLWVAVPAVIMGTIGSWYVNGIWMDLFAIQVPLGWPVYVLVGIANLLIITVCVIWKAWRIANENPVQSIKSE
ncbi:MAG: ABC transporter permease [Bacteroides sp.]|uniref:ABC transporter permease n=1 Tax=Bacteroides sp. TaxID=29523 RepID=UPI0025BAF48B|nr:ABC transporter permease [Bacteroides sp.]MBS6240244.1 ABC transporter permease [Bacteroides sp.]